MESRSASLRFRDVNGTVLGTKLEAVLINAKVMITHPNRDWNSIRLNIREIRYLCKAKGMQIFRVAAFGENQKRMQKREQ